MMGVKYRVCSLVLGPNCVVLLAGGKNFYLPLTVEKMHAFAVFKDKYLRIYGCSDTDFTAPVATLRLRSTVQI